MRPLPGPEHAIPLFILLVVGRPGAAQAPLRAAWEFAPRYATDGEGALFAGRTRGAWIVAEELTVDVRAGGWALGVGGGPMFSAGVLDVAMILGPVFAAPSWYAGLYVAPTVKTDRIAASGTFELFAPTTRGEPLIIELSHARLVYRTRLGLGFGAFVHLVRQGAAWEQAAAGPSFSFKLGPRATCTTDVAKGFAGTRGFVLTTISWNPR